MEVSNKIVLKPVTGDQSNDPGKITSASPSTPSPDNRNQQATQSTAVTTSSVLNLWPDSQQLTIPKVKKQTTVASNTGGSQKQAQYDLTLMKLEFSKDSKTGKIVVKIIDQNTDKVIRQVPPQEFLNIVHNMNKVAQELLKRLPKTI